MKANDTRELTTLQNLVCSSLCHPCCLPFPTVLLFFRYYLKSAHTHTHTHIVFINTCVKISCLAICSNMNGPGDHHSE